MAKINSRRITSSFLIGLFVISGTLLIIGVVIWLGASRFFEERKEYVTYYEGSVEGLETGSAVKYLGVPVGSVTDVRVAPNGKFIEVVFQIDKKITVDDSLRAKTELIGISGRKFLQLHYPSDKMMAAIYPEIDFKPDYPYIKSSPSGLEEIEIAMRDVVNNLRRMDIYGISTGMVEFLRTSNKFFGNPELYATISNLKESSIRLNNIVAEFEYNGTLEYVAKSGANLLKSTEELSLLINKVNSEFDEMALEQKVTSAFSAYDSTMNEARSAIQTIGFRADNTILNLNETMGRLNELNVQLKRALGAIVESPSSILFSEPPPKER